MSGDTGHNVRHQVGYQAACRVLYGVAEGEHPSRDTIAHAIAAAVEAVRAWEGGSTSVHHEDGWHNADGTVTAQPPAQVYMNTGAGLHADTHRGTIRVEVDKL